jgi:hypothetical protein
MRKESKLKHLFVSLMILGCSFGYTACSDDDDPVKGPPVLTDVYGEYSGKMTIVMPKTYATEQAEANIEGTDIAATVKNDTVSFAKFPVDAIIIAINPEGAQEIIKNLGDINYAVGYKAEFNAAKDSVVMDFSPKPLDFKFSMGEGEAAIEMAIIVDISTVNKGSYAIDKKNMKFAIKATGVTVNGAAYPFPETQFSFDMNKK